MKYLLSIKKILVPDKTSRIFAQVGIKTDLRKEWEKASD